MTARRWIRYQNGWAIERHQGVDGRWWLVLAWRLDRHGLRGPT